MNVDFSKTDPAAVAAAMPDEAEWRKQVEEICGDQAHVVFEQQKDKTFDKAKIQSRIECIIAHEPEIKEVIREAVKYIQPLESALKTLGAPTTAEEMCVSPAELRTSFLWAKEMRPKYVVLDLAYDLGVLEKIADEIL